MKVKFGTISYRLEGLLDCIHVDVWGPIKITSLIGHRYFISFADDLSKCRWVYPMRQKFEVLNCP